MTDGFDWGQDAEDTPAELDGRDFILTAPRFRAVTKGMSPRGEIFHDTKRYFKGDTLDGLYGEDVERLVRLNAAVPKVSAAEQAEAEAKAYADATAALDAAAAAADVQNGDEPVAPPAPVEPQGGTEEPQGDVPEAEGALPKGEASDAENKEPVVEPVPEPESVDFSNEEDYTVLKEAAAERGLDTSGKKTALRDRLVAFEAAKTVANDD